MQQKSSDYYREKFEQESAERQRVAESSMRTGKTLMVVAIVSFVIFFLYGLGKDDVAGIHWLILGSIIATFFIGLNLENAGRSRSGKLDFGLWLQDEKQKEKQVENQ